MDTDSHELHLKIVFISHASETKVYKLFIFNCLIYFYIFRFCDGRFLGTVEIFCTYENVVSVFQQQLPCLHLVKLTKVYR